ncbi:MAG: orotidine-5'-phosphate decarboxylase [Spirochaetes bacterium]|nr:orotidine-5'-phosphate decarboxylase [Spirochaetota bacterium]
MDYLDSLKLSYDKFNSIICLGLDPVIEDIPLSGDPQSVIVAFYEEILNKILQKKIYPSAVKPNYAFYAQYGMAGIDALLKIISLFGHEGFPVILDVKRGDIDKTAAAYAREAFDFYKADAVTLAPYMGFDSIHPFIELFPTKGYYVLTKTSNKSSIDIQDLMLDNEPLYLHVAKKITEWHQPGLGSVVGATYPEQLSQIALTYIRSGKEIPLLIPGIGAQGGSLEEVMGVLKQFHDIRIHRINSSSAINYAYKKHKKLHYAEAAVKALKELNDAVASSLES